MRNSRDLWWPNTLGAEKLIWPINVSIWRKDAVYEMCFVVKDSNHSAWYIHTYGCSIKSIFWDSLLKGVSLTLYHVSLTYMSISIVEPLHGLGKLSIQLPKCWVLAAFLHIALSSTTFFFLLVMIIQWKQAHSSNGKQEGKKYIRAVVHKHCFWWNAML